MTTAETPDIGTTAWAPARLGAVTLRIVRHPLVIPGVVLLVLMGYLHAKLNIIADDGFNITALPAQSFTAWFTDQYLNWTPRWIIDSLKWVLYHAFWSFRLLGTVMYLVWFVFMAKVFALDRTHTGAWITMLAVLIFPFRTMATAGYLATSISYVWPIALGLVAGYGITKALQRERIRWWQWVIYLAALLYAINQELVNVFMIGLLVFLIAYVAWVQRRVSWLLVVMLGLSIAQLVYVFTSPGEATRHADETMTFYPDFDTTSIFQRLQLGFFPMASAIMGNQNRTVLAAVLVLCAAVWMRHRDWFYRAVAAVPVAVMVFVGYSRIIESFAAIDMSRLTAWGALWGRDSMIRVANYDTLRDYVPLVIFGIAFLCIGLAAYLVFDDRPALGWLAAAILFLGFLTRIAMGFTPTAIGSGTRSFAFFYFALLAVLGLAANRMVHERPRTRYWLIPVLVVIAALSWWEALYGTIKPDTLSWGLV
jgi:hypothetical protein